MKELYISPELEILCFAPVEGIASLNPVFTNVGLKNSKLGGISVIDPTDDNVFDDDLGGDL